MTNETLLSETTFQRNKTMNTLTKKCLLTLVVIGSAVAVTDQVSACGSRGGYRRVAPSCHSYRSNYSHQHVYRAPHVVRHTPQPIESLRYAPQPVRRTPQPIQQPGQQFVERPMQQFQQQPVRQISTQPEQQFGGVQETPPVVNQVRRTLKPAGRLTEQQRTPQQRSPQQSALQMLSAFGVESEVETTPVVEPQVEQSQVQRPQFTEVGTWKATLANGAVVQLELAENRQFVWKAVSKGKLSTFSGNFNINNGTLTLDRANDSKKLTGSMTPNGLEAFTFQLQGTTDNGLEFVRG